MKGYVKLHRKLLNNPIFKNHKLLQTFLYCILNASHKSHKALIGDSIVSLNAGQLVTGRSSISMATGLSEQSVRTAISKLKTLEILTSTPTAKYSIITITNWDQYQLDNQQPTSCQPTANHKQEWNKNGKETIKASEDAETIPFHEIIALYHNHLPMLPSVKQLSDKRKKAIKARWHKGLSDLDEWKGYFMAVSKIKFLTEVANNGWQANIDFLIKPDTPIKVLEGIYK